MDSQAEIDVQNFLDHNFGINTNYHRQWNVSLLTFTPVLYFLPFIPERMINTRILYELIN